MDTEDPSAEAGTSWEDQVAAMPSTLTPREAAVILRMSEKTVRDLARAGDIPATRIGSSSKAAWRIPKRELLKRLLLEPDEFEPEDSPPDSD